MTTGAGKRLLAEHYGPERAETRMPSDQFFVLRAKIAAIEAEAVAAERARVAVALQSHMPNGDWESAQFMGCSCGLWDGFSPEGWSSHIAVAIVDPQ